MELHTKDEELKQFLFENVQRLSTGDWGDELIQPANRIQNDCARLADAQDKKQGRSGFWGTIVGNVGLWADSININQKIAAHKEELKTEALRVWGQTAKPSSPRALEILGNLAELGSQHKNVVRPSSNLKERKRKNFGSDRSEYSTVATKSCSSNQRKPFFRARRGVIGSPHYQPAY